MKSLVSLKKHYTYISIVKPTRCSSFSNLFILEIINKLQKLVHLVLFTTETYYDAETYERQTAYTTLLCLAPRPGSVDL
jgi:hypothetical protein